MAAQAAVHQQGLAVLMGLTEQVTQRGLGKEKQQESSERKAANYIPAVEMALVQIHLTETKTLVTAEEVKTITTLKQVEADQESSLSASINKEVAA